MKAVGGLACLLTLSGPLATLVVVVVVFFEAPDAELNAPLDGLSGDSFWASWGLGP